MLRALYWKARGRRGGVLTAEFWSSAICRQEKSGWPVLGLANHVQGKCVHGHLQPFRPKWCEILRALENGVVVEGCN